MKMISWNVNGIRAAVRNGFLTFVQDADPDIICLQETKAHPDQIHVELPGYWQYWNSAARKGYSGTAVFSRREPLSAANGMGMPEHDGEGRVITLEYPEYYLVNVYTPNAQHELARLDRGSP